MAVTILRIPSETPNINNTDDFIGLRYAYGNQSGYVKSVGDEISYTINGSNFIINSGRIVVQGVESNVDASGVTLTIDYSSTKRYYSVYLQVNLATNAASILSQYETSGYPTIDEGDDLMQNTTGTARLLLYTFTATSGVIENIKKKISDIKYYPIIQDNEIIDKKILVNSSDQMEEGKSYLLEFWVIFNGAVHISNKYAYIHAPSVRVPYNYVEFLNFSPKSDIEDFSLYKITYTISTSGEFSAYLYKYSMNDENEIKITETELTVLRVYAYII